MHNKQRRRGPGPAVLLVLAVILAGGSLYGLYYGLLQERPQTETIYRLRYQHEGVYDYVVHLKPNALFDSTEMAPGGTYFAELVNDIAMTFSYRLSADRPLIGRRYQYEVVAFFETAGLWQKSFVLVPPTTTNDDFTVSFALPVENLMELLTTAREEAKVSLDAPVLRVVTRVQARVDSGDDALAEDFEQSLSFSFANQLIRPDPELRKVEPGSLSDTRVVAAQGTSLVRGFSLGALLLAGVMATVAGSQLNSQRFGRQDDPALIAARKHLKGRLVQAQSVPDARADETIIQLDSLKDLIALSDEILRPVIYGPNGHGPCYCIIDGASRVRYYYQEAHEVVGGERDTVHDGKAVT